MSSAQYTIEYNGFYYASVARGGQQITSMSVADDANLRTALRNFACQLDFSGYNREERFVYCPPLRSMCKIFICRDVTNVRNFFYHITLADVRGLRSICRDEILFDTNALIAQLGAVSDADGSSQPAVLPRECKDFTLMDTDALPVVLSHRPELLAKLAFFAVLPFIPGGRPVLLSTPSDGRNPAEFSADGRMNALAALLLSLLPKAVYPALQLRFSSDLQTAQQHFNCTHVFIADAPKSDFDLTDVTPLSAQEDVYGIYTAIGNYIIQKGLSQYRRNILPHLESWLQICRERRTCSYALLYLMLKGVQGLSLPQADLSARELYAFLETESEAWFDACAPSLVISLANERQAAGVLASLQKNSLYNREKLPENKKDGFLTLFAACCSVLSQEKKQSLFTALYDRYAASENGMRHLAYIKQEMRLTLSLPADPAPQNLFEGMHALEKKNTVYVTAAARHAVSAYIRDGNDEWMGCIHTLYGDPDTAAVAAACLAEKCEALFAAAEDRKTLAWLCAACASSLAEEPQRRSNVVGILFEKRRIAYDELLHCAHILGLREDALPQLPDLAPLDEKYNSLARLADVRMPTDPTSEEQMRLRVLQRLCKLLEQDCTWEDFAAFVPEILDKIRYRPTTPLHPKLEMLLCRQLVVLAPDVLGLNDGQIAYVSLLARLRRDHCLRLYPTTGAASGDFEEKSGLVSSLKKLLLRTLPLLPLCLCVTVTVLCLYVLLPMLGETSSLHTVLPAVFAGIGAVLLIVQAAILRKNATGEYILPSAVTMLLLSLLRLLL